MEEVQDTFIFKQSGIGPAYEHFKVYGNTGTTYFPVYY